MSNNLKYVGTEYTATAALLVAALVFTPFFLFLSRPFGYGGVAAAFACSISCAAFAWFQWKRNSELTIPSIAAAKRERK
jgi:hypothetical protein